ncbi:2-phospho-L-lactate guanylyltransferase [Halopenitus sp. H-Gu1]|uniref:2-phospho-L-lactate guanylyltransferase n=1 Tax=Halopenitus sp. H-Gu1 TaxID=3242697 RepID=UPI00359E0DC6
MDVIVPFATRNPKTRLSDVLDRRERNAFARAMLADVLEAIDAAGGTPHVLATRPLDRDLDIDRGSFPPIDAETIVDDRDLTTAVNATLAASFEESTAFGPPLAVVMSDLPLATPTSLRTLLETKGEVVLAPGRAGGTNAIVVRHPSFRVDYHGASIRDHRRAARSIDADLVEIDSRQLASDVDDPDDLVEVLVHGDGRSRDWLVDAGFELAVDDGSVEVVRNDG